MREQEKVELALIDNSERDDQERLLPSTAVQTYTLFKDGHSVADIARERSLVTNTIESHLIECLEAGLAVDLSRLLSTADRAQIEQTISDRGLDKGLKPIRESLPESITYNMIRFIVAEQRLKSKPM